MHIMQQKDLTKPLDYKAMWKDEKQRRQFAENELALIKGIGNNSPEMKALREQVKELKAKPMPYIKVLSKNIDIVKKKKPHWDIFQIVSVVQRIMRRTEWKKYIG